MRASIVHLSLFSDKPHTSFNTSLHGFPERFRFYLRYTLHPQEADFQDLIASLPEPSKCLKRNLESISLGGAVFQRSRDLRPHVFPATKRNNTCSPNLLKKEPDLEKITLRLVCFLSFLFSERKVCVSETVIALYDSLCWLNKHSFKARV